LGYFTQMPSWHDTPGVQALPHDPQLLVSDCVEMHAPPQLTSPDAHSILHSPFTHVSPVPHTRPHTPQFFASRARSTQIAPHAACPSGHPFDDNT